ncbi:hypothetical protein Tco_0225877, partial [Tanacetum coccineum]
VVRADQAAALGFYQRDNGNPSYQERRQTMEESSLDQNSRDSNWAIKQSTLGERVWKSSWINQNKPERSCQINLDYCGDWSSIDTPYQTNPICRIGQIE